jgi:hypothetical protein
VRRALAADRETCDDSSNRYPDYDVRKRLAIGEFDHCHDRCRARSYEEADQFVFISRNFSTWASIFKSYSETGEEVTSLFAARRTYYLDQRRGKQGDYTPDKVLGIEPRTEQALAPNVVSNLDDAGEFGPLFVFSQEVAFLGTREAALRAEA